MRRMKTKLQVRLPIMLKTKEGMPSGTSPSLVACIFLEYYLGSALESPSLGSCHSLFSSYRYLTQNLKTSITQNITEFRDIGQYDKEQTISLLVLSKTRSIIVLTQFLLQISFPQFMLSNIIRRNQKTSKLCIENKNLSKTEQSVVICTLTILM